jgi:type II secretory pathway pseudopilin PulG
MDRGFSLLSVLITALVIGILFAYALPRYYGGEGKAEEAQNAAIVRQVKEMQTDPAHRGGYLNSDPDYDPSEAASKYWER